MFCQAKPWVSHGSAMSIRSLQGKGTGGGRLVPAVFHIVQLILCERLGFSIYRWHPLHKKIKLHDFLQKTNLECSWQSP